MDSAALPRLYSKEDVYFGAPCIDPDNFFAMVDIIEESGTQHHVLLDPGGSVYSIMKQPALPTTVIIDADGVLHFSTIGYSSSIKRDIVDTIEELLTKK